MSNTLQLASAAAIAAAGAIANSVQATTAIGAGDYTINLQITNNQAMRIRIGIEDSPDGTTWTPLQVWEIAGPSPQQARGARQYNVPGLKTGTGAQARLNVYEIAGGSASVTASITW